MQRCVFLPSSESPIGRDVLLTLSMVSQEALMVGQRYYFCGLVARVRELKGFRR
jgi:hypothetical protein